MSGDARDPRYAAVWVQRPGPAWRAFHDVHAIDYQHRFDEIVAEGYAPVIVTATGPRDQAVFAAVFATGQPRWFARHKLRWGARTDPDTVEGAMDRAYREGYLPISVAVYGTAGDPNVAGVWSDNPSSLWAWYWGDDGHYQRTFNAQVLGGLHPSQVAVGSGNLLSVFTDDHIGRWSARHDMRASDYAAAVGDAARDGLRPIFVQAGDAGGTSYAAAFAADDVPMPRRWHAEGTAVAGVADLDRVFSDVMRRFGVRAGTVAIAKQGTIYAQRAYTWAEVDWPATTTATTFRIASVSKTFTCAAVQLLHDAGAINLDARVFAYLGIPTTLPHDPRADTITIRQCATGLSGLPMDFNGPTFRDIGVGLGHMASIRELATRAYGLPLRFNPGMPPAGVDGYSNSAFHVLGAVVEQASGRQLVDFVNDRLAKPLGIADVRAGATAAGARLPGEVAGYQASGVGPSQLDLAPDAIAPDAYGGALLLDSAPGSGGLVTSATSIARFISLHAVWDLGGRGNATRYGTFRGTSAGATTSGDWDLAFLLNREVDNPVKDSIRDGVLAYLATHGSSLTPIVDRGFPIRGVLLLGGFRTHSQLNAMTRDDMRNTLIVVLTGHSNQRDYQAYDDPTLAGMGAVMVFLLRTGIRDAAALRTMSADDHRNTLIVAIDAQTGAGRGLQGLTNMELVLVGLGSDRAVRGRVPGAVSFWVRGVLLVGGLRTQQQLNEMSQEDMRNTLIVELTARSNQFDYQRYNNADLAGVGAVLVALRTLGIRDDAALRTMSADDQRNTLIAALDAQTRRGASLQSLDNLRLALTALGAG